LAAGFLTGATESFFFLVEVSLAGVAAFFFEDVALEVDLATGLAEVAFFFYSFFFGLIPFASSTFF